MKLRLALIAAVITLTGCPQTPVSGDKPDQTDKPQQPQQQQPLEETPPVLSALGAVRTQIEQSRFTMGDEVSYVLRNWAFDPAYLLAPGASPISGYFWLLKPRGGDNPTHYVEVETEAEATAILYVVTNPESQIIPYLEASLGQTPATRISLNSRREYVFTFPRSASGQLVIRPKADHETLIANMRDRWDAASQTHYYQAEATFALAPEEAEEYATHATNAELTVVVQELDGKAVTGLKKENFALILHPSLYLDPTVPYNREPARILSVQETSAGRYTVLGTFDDLPGTNPRSRKLSIQIHNAPIELEVEP
ncbi:hypothetical protein J7643_18005 [bacterium]|nr:hypothetical protein [bacterium]